MDVTAFTWSTGTGKLTTRHTYDDAGRLETQISDFGGLAATTTYTYDDHGWTLSSTSPESRVTSYTYDANGQITQMTVPYQDSGTASQLRSFDPSGRLISETDFATSPTGSTPSVDYTYSANGWMKSVTDPLGTRTDFEYNDRGLRTERISTQTTGAAPNCASPPSSTCVVETWGYDGAGQMTSHVVPRDGTNDTTFAYGYDTNGRPKWIQEPLASGQLRCETYSYTNHLLTEIDYWQHASDCSGSPSSSTVVAYDYDALDRRIELTDTRDGITETVDLTYDQASNLIQRTDNHTGETTKWRHSLNGQPYRLFHNDGAILRFTHDHLGRLNTTSAAYLGVWVPLVAHTWDDDGLLTREDLNNSTTRFRDYDRYNSGQLANYQQNLSTSDLTETLLTWQEDGNLASECTDATLNDTCTGATNYAYDNADQILGSGPGCALTSGGVPDTNCDTTWAYNGTGVRTSHITPTATISYTTNRASQITNETITGGNTRDFTYDWSGRLTTINEDDNTSADVEDTTMSYRPNGRLGTIDIDSGSAIYDLHYDGDNNLVLWENDTNGDTTIDSTLEFVWDPTTNIPQILDAITDADAAGPNTAIHNRQNYGMRRVNSYGDWYAYDHQGSVIASTDYPNHPTTYDPYGNPDTTPGLHFGYRGELQAGDWFIHLHNRNYQPSLGQFTTRDPLDGVDGTPTVANPYHYVDNDPLNKTDPLGLRPQGDDVFGGGMVLGSSAYVAGFPEPNCVWDVFPWCPGYTGTDPAEAAYLIWRTSTEVAGGAQARLSRISSGTTSPGNDAMGGVLAAWSVMRGGDASLLQCRWSDALLPVKCIFNDRVATTFDQPGYARGHTIFCYYDEGRCESEGVIDHELVHVNQYDRYGDSAFVLFEAEIKRHGYWCSKYEMEAFGDDGQSRCDASRGGG